jgi:glycosyltransferase involved in cell wall biosynthesis
MISIVIATYNSEKHLQYCINSIKSQLNEYAQIIVIDGCSIDNTVDIIINNAKYIYYWESKMDNGIYEAWNKGILKANGNWIMFLGSDDILLPGAINAYISFIEDNGEDYDIISSKIEYMNYDNTLIKIIGEPWNFLKFKMSRMSFAHPGLLHNKYFFEKFGLFNDKYKICGDSELFLRTNGDLKAGFLNCVTVRMKSGGASDSIKALKESYQIRQIHKSIPYYLNIFRFIYTYFLYLISRIKRHLL